MQICDLNTLFYFLFSSDFKSLKDPLGYLGINSCTNCCAPGSLLTQSSFLFFIREWNKCEEESWIVGNYQLVFNALIANLPLCKIQPLYNIPKNITLLSFSKFLHSLKVDVVQVIWNSLPCWFRLRVSPLDLFAVLIQIENESIGPLCFTKMWLSRPSISISFYFLAFLKWMLSFKTLCRVDSGWKWVHCTSLHYMDVVESPLRSISLCYLVSWC